MLLDEKEHHWKIDGPDPPDVPVPEYLIIARNHLASRGHRGAGENYPGLNFGPTNKPEAPRDREIKECHEFSILVFLAILAYFGVLILWWIIK